jgi:hypothetical protein
MESSEGSIQWIALFSIGAAMAQARARKTTSKKDTPKSDSQGTRGTGSKAKTAEEVQQIRNTVTNLILDSSEDMTKRVMKSVIEGGQVAALKFLWEMSGMFPFEAGEDGERESLAKILLSRMGLQGQVPVIAEDDEGDVESEDELQESD